MHPKLIKTLKRLHFLFIQFVHFFLVQLKQSGSKAALVYGQMNEPPGARARVALTGIFCVCVEHFALWHLNIIEKNSWWHQQSDSHWFLGDYDFNCADLEMWFFNILLFLNHLFISALSFIHWCVSCWWSHRFGDCRIFSWCWKSGCVVVRW